jgi:endonuclease/exonuclease/phosphatase family metal-dependent hydrolase
MFSSERKQTAFVFALAVLFLFFFQLLSDFFESLYAFGLMGTSIPAEIVTVVVLFSPFLLLVFKSGPAPWAVTVTGMLVLVARLAEAPLNTRGKMLVSGLGAACFLLFFPLLIHRLAGKTHRETGARLAVALGLALTASVLLRALNSGSEMSTQGWYQLIGWAMALPAAFLLPGVAGREAVTAENHDAPGETTAKTPRRGLAVVIGLVLGVMSVMILLLFALVSPVVLTRWTGASFPLVVLMLVGSLAAYFWAAAADASWLWRPGRAALFLVVALFGLALATAALVHQARFPAAADGYPLLAPSPGLAGQLPLYVALLLTPLLLVTFARLLETLIKARPSIRALSLAFGLGGLYLLLAVLAHVFTTTYDYIPVVGPAFRDRFWLLHLVVGAALALSTWLARPVSAGVEQPRLERRAGRKLAGLVTLMGIAAVAAILLSAARPPAPPESGSVTVLTYNIQQGFSEGGSRNYDGQLAVIRDLDPQIVGLQETDTARLSGGNADVARYLADRLDMHSYYGPTTVNGTFGIALLSRYPIEEARTYYLYSEGEQVAVIEARLTIAGQPYQVYVNHLGNGGPPVQQEQFLQLVEGRERVIAVGDYNFRPGTEQYRLTTTQLADAWALRWPQGVDAEGRDKSNRIDHIFVSGDLEVIDAGYIDSPASDHPAAHMTFTP